MPVIVTRFGLLNPYVFISSVIVLSESVLYCLSIALFADFEILFSTDSVKTAFSSVTLEEEDKVEEGDYFFNGKSAWIFKVEEIKTEGYYVKFCARFNVEPPKFNVIMKTNSEVGYTYRDSGGFLGIVDTGAYAEVSDLVMDYELNFNGQ